jgi:SlyX protein
MEVRYVSGPGSRVEGSGERGGKWWHVSSDVEREDGLEERVVGLELKFTEQQALLEDLSGVVHEQQREIAMLRAEIERLKGRLGAVEERVPQAAAEKPPHY